MVGWSINLCTEGSLVRFLVGAHTEIVGLLLGWGMYERQKIDVAFSHQCFSISLSLPLSLISVNVSVGED